MQVHQGAHLRRTIKGDAFGLCLARLLRTVLWQRGEFSRIIACEPTRMTFLDVPWGSPVAIHCRRKVADDEPDGGLFQHLSPGIEVTAFQSANFQCPRRCVPRRNAFDAALCQHVGLLRRRQLQGLKPVRIIEPCVGMGGVLRHEKGTRQFNNECPSRFVLAPSKSGSYGV